MKDRRVVAMKIYERLQNLVTPAQDIGSRKRPAAYFKQLGQVITGNELHYQVLPVTFGEMVYDIRQRGMAQIRQQAGFAGERVARFSRAEEIFFDGDNAAESLIDRFIDSPHATLPKLAHNAVAILKKSVRDKHVLSAFVGLLRRKSIWCRNGRICTAWHDSKLKRAPLAITALDQSDSGRREVEFLHE